jgi:hypothetical protein
MHDSAMQKTSTVRLVAVWIAQIFVAVIFCYAAYLKLLLPIADLPAKNIRWAADLPAWQVRALGLVDLAGGLGILLPSLTGVMPRLTGFAALGCVALQLCAITFHILRGESNVIGINIALLVAAAFVAWGRL